ncbi:MAG: hypothetical protein ABI616_13910 [Pseudomonadota bacterium]
MDLMHYEYLNSSADPETFGRALLSGTYDFVPDHFSWNAAIDFDQQRGDLLQPIAPGNVENVTTLSTGPTLRGELFGAMDTELDGHYERAYYSGNSVDNQTVGGKLKLGRRSGPKSRFGLGGSIDDVSYLGGPLSSALDFQRSEAFLYGDLNGARTDFSAELGYSQADGESFSGEGPLARLRLERKMSPDLSGFLGFRLEYPTSQQGLSVSDPTPSGGGIVNTSLVTSSPRQAQTGELGFNYSRTRSQASIGIYRLDEKSLIAALGHHTYDELRASVTRTFTPLARGTLYASYSKEDFSAAAQKYDEVRGGAVFAYDFTRSVGIDVRIEYQERNADGNNSSYNEFNGGVFLRYSGSLLGRNTATSSGIPLVR